MRLGSWVSLRQAQALYLKCMTKTEFDAIPEGEIADDCHSGERAAARQRRRLLSA
jgi:hypothetical protein